MSRVGTDEASNIDVLSRVKTSKSKEIEYLTSDIVNIALTKLYNEVGSRTGPQVAQ
jgi:hypothetical protein